MRSLFVSRNVQLAVVACVCALATGCHRKTKAPPPPALPPPTAVALVPAPEPSTPPQVQPVPVTPLPALPAQPQPKRKKKKLVTPVAPAPVEVANNTPPPPPVNGVGALTAGSDSSPAVQQKAAASVADVEKQLGGLSAATLDAQKDGVARVKNFLRQAHEALKSGDAEGALTRAGKAKVLLDDLLK